MSKKTMEEFVKENGTYDKQKILILFHAVKLTQ